MTDTDLATIEANEPPTGLSGRHERFCNEYLIDFNGTKAAIRAGYSEISACSTASLVLTYPKIKDRLEILKAEQLEQLGVTPFSILRSLACIANGDVRNVFGSDGELLPVSDWDDATAMAVQSVDIATLGRQDQELTAHLHKIKMYDRQRALELLGKHANLFIEQVNHTGQIDTKWLVEYKNAEPTTTE